MVSIPHLVNLTAALECSLRLAADGPRVVGEFRSLVAHRIIRHAVTPSTHEQHELTKEVRPLGEWLDAWVNSLTQTADLITDELHPNDDAQLQRPVIRIKLTTPLTAEVTLPDHDGSASYDVIYFCTADALPGLTAGEPSKLSRAEVVIGLEEMQALATIARRAYMPPADLLNRSALSPGRDSSGGEAPETTKASGTGIHEGLQSVSPAPKAQTRPLNKAQSATKQESKQLLPDLVVSRSQVRHPPAIGRKRHNGANWSSTSPG